MLATGTLTGGMSTRNVLTRNMLTMLTSVIRSVPRAMASAVFVVALLLFATATPPRAGDVTTAEHTVDRYTLTLDGMT